MKRGPSRPTVKWEFSSLIEVGVPGCWRPGGEVQETGAGFFASTARPAIPRPMFDPKRLIRGRQVEFVVKNSVHS